MAKSISEEELQLKKRARRRLMGAIALVFITAVFLPMVLEHEPKPVVQNIDIQIPSPDNAGAFTSKIVPVIPSSAPALEPESAPPDAAPPSASSQPAPAITEPQPADIKLAEPTPAKAPEQKPVTVAAPSKAIAKLEDKPKPQQKPKAEVVSTGFVVQVAALNDTVKAKQIQQQMTAAGIKTYTEPVATASGTVTRVRAGPFKTRTEAEQARDKLKNIGLSGNVVPKSP